MKKHLLTLISGCALLLSTGSLQAQRYVDDVFTDVVKQSNIVYDSNRSVNILYGTVPGQLPIITVNLKCDVYTPANDTSGSKRPLVIVAGTGSYLPAILNRQTTGNKSDSSIVELCTRLAKKGYVAVAIDYRQGWNPQTTIEADAKEQLLKATFRAIQDVRNAVRFFRVNASTYGVDTSKIVVGGQGTGGYVALGVASVNKRAEIESNVKFLRVDFSPMVNVDTLGDWNGLGGVTLPIYPFTFNYSGDPAVSGNVHMVFNYGGAIGDSSWLDNASIPVVGLHSMYDPFAPYMTGNVKVPGTNLTVIPSASGAGAYIPFANSLGINNKINSYNYTDPYSTRAMSINGGVKNLFPFIPPTLGDGAPWEWWDRTGIQAIQYVPVNGFPTVPASGRVADSLSMLTNPTMSASKGKAYIDTVVNFVCRRIAVQFDFLSSGVQELPLNESVSVYPNPASEMITVSAKTEIRSVTLFDITGKSMMTGVAAGNNNFLNVSGLSSGIYFIKVDAVDGRSTTKRVVVQ